MELLRNFLMTQNFLFGIVIHCGAWWVLKWWFWKWISGDQTQEEVWFRKSLASDLCSVHLLSSGAKEGSPIHPSLWRMAGYAILCQMLMLNGCPRKRIRLHYTYLTGSGVLIEGRQILDHVHPWSTWYRVILKGTCWLVKYIFEYESALMLEVKQSLVLVIVCSQS